MSTATPAIAPSEPQLAKGSGRISLAHYQLAPEPAGTCADAERGNEQHYSKAELAFFEMGEQLSGLASRAHERKQGWWRRLLSIERKALKEQ